MSSDCGEERCHGALERSGTDHSKGGIRYRNVLFASESHDSTVEQARGKLLKCNTGMPSMIGSKTAIVWRNTVDMVAELQHEWAIARPSKRSPVR
jgi:hypothetical protein